MCLFGLIVLSLLCGCATPAQRVDKLAVKYGFERAIVDSKNFQHVVYFNPSLSRLESEIQIPDDSTAILHIYLEGDGSPWLRRQTVATDPTPRNPLALTLMAQDNQASVYIGRPCYFGFSHSAACNPLLWTHQRYAQIVVDSISEVANKIIAKYGFERVRLIGYSGGGVIAMLMADHIAQLDSIVTIAANLDIGAWTKHHKYSQLAGSIDPAKQPSLRPEIRQWHLLGEDDENVPPQLVQKVMGKQVGQSEQIHFDGFDHVCCWAEQWPRIMLLLQ